MLDATKA